MNGSGAAESVEGLADSYAMFGRLPDAAREQIGVEMAIAARQVLALQRQYAPKRTGALAGALSIALEIEKMRVRIGLLGLKSSKAGKRHYGDFYYGRFVALGRRGYTVLVKRMGGRERRRKAAKNPRKTPLELSYPMRVKAMPARDFIRVPGADDMVLGQLADFWAKTLKRAERA